jgi:hypothetical protein
MDPAKLAEWKRANPEAARRFEEAGKDPEQRKGMAESSKVRTAEGHSREG